MPGTRKPLTEAETRKAAKTIAALVDGLQTVIRGKRRFLEDLVACAAAGGHALIEDLPGTGKTTVAKALARLIARPAAGRSRKAKSAEFKRIQFTPDLLPYDITGVDVFDPSNRSFVFQPGPIFADIVLADEINRTTPKVQSALLEAMAERQVTVGSRTHGLPEFFFVVATQNHAETEGTYPLPLAQLDRFMLRLSLGYPDREAELSILRDEPGETLLDGLSPAVGMADLVALRDAAARVSVDQSLMEAAADLAEASRADPRISLGISPRGALMFLRAARARALCSGRSWVSGQDLADMAVPALAHRLRARDARLDLANHLREACVAAIERREKR